MGGTVGRKNRMRWGEGRRAVGGIEEKRERTGSGIARGQAVLLEREARGAGGT